MLAVLAAVAMLPACGSITGPTTYPGTWPPLAFTTLGDRCPDLNGVYDNVGSAAHPPAAGGTPKLTEVFGRMERTTAITGPRAWGQSWGVPADAERVALVQDEQGLTVTFQGPGGAAHSLRFRRLHLDPSERRVDDFFTCYRDDNGMRLRFMQDIAPRTALLPGVYAGAQAGLVFLLKAVDGSLVVQFRTETIGVSAVLIGSHASFDSVWWRYPAAGGKP
ncbi:MAG TPA: hypothetical protein VGD76_03340 [Ramlibacter sp.]